MTNKEALLIQYGGEDFTDKETGLYPKSDMCLYVERLVFNYDGKEYELDMRSPLDSPKREFDCMPITGIIMKGRYGTTRKNATLQPCSRAMTLMKL